jgi:hypothetical protein
MYSSTSAFSTWRHTTASKRGPAGPIAPVPKAKTNAWSAISSSASSCATAFESWAHLNQLLEQWLRAEADQRCHGTLKEVVAERFGREAPALQPLPAHPYDTSYRELRRASWDSYVEVRGNRYSVPAALVGQMVVVRIGLDGELRVYQDEQVVATHQLQAAVAGWVTVPEHHAALWKRALAVEQRPLEVYEEVGQWN